MWNGGARSRWPRLGTAAGLLFDFAMRAGVWEVPTPIRSKLADTGTVSAPRIGLPIVGKVRDPAVHCTPDGAVLAARVAALIDKRFPTRATFLEALTEKSQTTVGDKVTPPCRIRDRRQLSEQLGSSRKKHGPDWDVITWVVQLCVAPEDQGSALAVLAALFKAANGHAPKGYDAPVGLRDTADNGADTRADNTPDNRADTAPDISPDTANAAYSASECGADNADNFVGNVVGNNADNADNGKAGDAGLIRTGYATDPMVRALSDCMAHNAALRDETDELRRQLATTAADRVAAMSEAESRGYLLQEQRSLAAHALQRVDREHVQLVETREGFARMTAELFLVNGNPSPTTEMVLAAVLVAAGHRRGIRIEASAPPENRALAAYLHVWTAFHSVSVVQIARATGVDVGTANAIFSGMHIPTRQQLDSIVDACGADPEHSYKLLSAAQIAHAQSASNTIDHEFAYLPGASDRVHQMRASTSLGTTPAAGPVRQRPYVATLGFDDFASRRTLVPVQLKSPAGAETPSKDAPAKPPEAADLVAAGGHEGDQAETMTAEFPIVANQREDVDQPEKGASQDAGDAPGQDGRPMEPDEAVGSTGTISTFSTTGLTRRERRLQDRIFRRRRRIAVLLMLLLVLTLASFFALREIAANAASIERLKDRHERIQRDHSDTA